MNLEVHGMHPDIKLKYAHETNLLQKDLDGLCQKARHVQHKYYNYCTFS